MKRPELSPFGAYMPAGESYETQRWRCSKPQAGLDSALSVPRLRVICLSQHLELDLARNSILAAVETPSRLSLKVGVDLRYCTCARGRAKSCGVQCWRGMKTQNRISVVSDRKDKVSS